MTEEKFRSACDLFRSLITEGKREIENKERRIDYLQSEIDRLTSEPHPDTHRIKELRESQRKLDEELVNDRLQQQALEEEYQANCL